MFILFIYRRNKFTFINVFLIIFSSHVTVTVVPFFFFICTITSKH